MPSCTTPGDEDDDWFFTFYQPYRYLLNRIPVYPSIGNHDSAETEDRDDREQVLDNMFLRERMATDEATGKASMDPGLFYRVRYGADIELICLDTSKEHFFSRGRLIHHPEHQAFLEESLQIAESDQVRWRIPFCHHPPYSAGPRHHNTERHASADGAVPRGAGARDVQRPRAQLSALAG